jgi:hypothetical protein
MGESSHAKTNKQQQQKTVPFESWSFDPHLPTSDKYQRAPVSLFLVP